mgnify:CR=1 FL=1
MRLYYGGYGHHPSGKQYVYWGNNNFRTGQNVVAPVTNKWSGKTYNTMFTIMRTSGADSPMADNEAQRLSQGGIGIKSIVGYDTSILPGAGNFDSKKAWKIESENRYDQKIRTRLLQDKTSYGNTFARGRLLGGN